MNAQEKLLEEIERVIRLRSNYEELRGLPNVVVEPQIMMMNASINSAKAAAASGDGVEVIRALNDLDGWQE